MLAVPAMVPLVGVGDLTNDSLSTYHSGQGTFHVLSQSGCLGVHVSQDWIVKVFCKLND